MTTMGKRGDYSIDMGSMTEMGWISLKDGCNKQPLQTCYGT